jgi:hypothetical protein
MHPELFIIDRSVFPLQVKLFSYHLNPRCQTYCDEGKLTSIKRSFDQTILFVKRLVGEKFVE